MCGGIWGSIFFLLGTFKCCLNFYYFINHFNETISHYFFKENGMVGEVLPDEMTLKKISERNKEQEQTCQGKTILDMFEGP